MRRTVILALLAASTQMWIQPSEGNSIKMGYFELRPHMYVSESSGLAMGAAIRYFERIAAAMDVTVEWVGPLPYSRMMSYLENGGPIDGSPVMSLNADRQRFLSYPKNHFYIAKPNFVVRRDNPLDRIVTPDDVNGFVVGQFKKAANSRFVIEHKDNFRFDLLETGNLLFEQQLKKLISGRIDAIHTLDEYTLLYEGKRLGVDQQVKILFLPEDSWPFYSAFSKRRGGDRLAEAFDAAFERSGYHPREYHQLIALEFARLPGNK